MRPHGGAHLAELKIRLSLLPLIVLFSAAGGIASAAFAVVFLWVREEQSGLILPHFVSFATGALLGAALLALLPEAVRAAGPDHATAIGLAILIGLGVFFIIEKLVLWWHAAKHSAQEPHSREQASGALVLVGDSLHNALDGVLIAAAFLTSVSLGVVTTVAVAAHEIPHRVGDFAILVQAGFSRQRALLLNCATGVASVIGAVAAYLGLRAALGMLPYALALAAGGFLYIALASLVPSLLRRTDPRISAVQLLLMSAGVAVIACAEYLTGE
jgi:zinc and cadmium transporter